MNNLQPDIRAIFCAALDRQSPADVAQFLDVACAGDAESRAQVEALLDSHRQAGKFLGGTGSGEPVTTDQPLADRVGSQVGRYKLLEQIGEGGMGVVFVAEQTEPVRRRVALKIIKPGMDTKQVVARFEAERQALAMMDHPNIAKVFDAGTTGDRDSGLGTRGSDFERHPLTPNPESRAPASALPYFVMELVRGMPITEYCDKARLSPRQRLELFVDVCQAVQHAHQKGIIHRDLKPSNVLITLHDGTPVVKVIDFGVAKAVGQQLTERTIYTALTQLVGTPLYMSPEQVEMSGLDVDTRSDVYSLGVLLYELLTGQTPFDKETLGKAGPDEMRRMIREDEPLRPSRRFSTLGAQAISTVSQHRSLDERRLSKILCGELDWIVMKSLEKDRTRRYETASSLATDIQRYLSDEPVLACPPTTMYRFQKFARKHKPALATAAALAACLILGTTVSAWQAVRATTAEAQANANEAQAKEAVASEAQQRQRAEANEQKANTQRDEVKAVNDELQRTLYAAHMNLAHNAWGTGNMGRVDALLDQHRLKPGESDLRGFEWHYLNRLCHPELLTLKGSSDFVWSVAFSPDGKRLVSAEGNTVKVWDAQTGQELLSLKEGGYHVSFSPDSKRLAGVLNNKTVKVWDAQTGQELLSLNEGGGLVTFSPDGKRLVTRSEDKSEKVWKVWDAQTGRELLSLKGGGSSVSFSPDGKRLATPGMVWDAQTGVELLAFKGQSKGVNSVAFSPDGKRVAIGAMDSTVKVWDTLTGEELIALKGHGGQVNAAVYSPDGKRLASASGDRTAKVWDAETGQELFTFKGHTNLVTSVAFSPDGTRLASAAMDGTVKVWNATMSLEARTFSGPNGSFRGVTFSPDGKRLASSSSGTWDDTKQVYVGGELKLWDAQSGQELHSTRGHAHLVWTVAFSPDGKRLAGTLDDKTLKVWDAQTVQELLTLRGHTDRCFNVAFSPDGKRLASASYDKTVKVWDVETGQELFTFKGHSNRVNALAFSPDGKHLASGAQDGTVQVWNSETGQVVLALKGHMAQESSVAFSPDGKRLASCINFGPGGVGEVRVWDGQTGEELLTLKGHTAQISSVVFSPDGKRLASGSGNPIGGQGGEVKIWDANKGLELLTFKGGSYRHRVAFSPSGHWLASDAGGAVKIYDATPLPEKP